MVCGPAERGRSRDPVEGIGEHRPLSGRERDDAGHHDGVDQVVGDLAEAAGIARGGDHLLGDGCDADRVELGIGVDGLAEDGVVVGMSVQIREMRLDVPAPIVELSTLPAEEDFPMMKCYEK